MFKTFTQLLILRPRSLIDRAKNLIYIFVNEIENSISKLKLKIAFYTISFFCFGLGTFSSAVSILLWAALPLLNPNNSWILIFLPMIFILIGVGFYYVASIYKIKETLSKRIAKHLKYEMNEFFSNLEK
jgi:hypothetical protein